VRLFRAPGDLPFPESPLWNDRWYNLATRASCALHGHIWRMSETGGSRDCARCPRMEILFRGDWVTVSDELLARAKARLRG
jgi:hypothetical protein